MVNPGMDGSLKPQINGMYSKKCKKTNTCWKPIERIL